MLLKNGLTSNERIQRPRRTLRRGKNQTSTLPAITQTGEQHQPDSQPTKLKQNKLATKTKIIKKIRQRQKTKITGQGQLKNTATFENLSTVVITLVTKIMTGINKIRKMKIYRMKKCQFY